MGASSWKYFVPYQADIGKAFDELREDVFRRGEYSRPFVMSPEEKERMRRINEELRKNYPGIAVSDPSDDNNPPATIEELIRRCGEEGTHSILDMHEVSAEPRLFTVSPLDEEDLTGLFGTIWPTREMAEAKMNELMDLSDRWVGTYLILYKGQQPDEILFVGASGD